MASIVASLVAAQDAVVVGVAIVIGVVVIVVAIVVAVSYVVVRLLDDRVVVAVREVLANIDGAAKAITESHASAARERLEQQARRVLLELTETFAGSSTEGLDGAIAVRVINESDDAVYDVRVVYRPGGLGEGTDDLQRRDRSVIPARHNVPFYFHLPPHVAGVASTDFGLMFLDARGKTWLRRADASPLEPFEPDPPPEEPPAEEPERTDLEHPVANP